MAIREITRDEWFPFLDAFSGLHRGWRVTVAVRRGDEELTQSDAELDAITAEPDHIEVLVREEDGAHALVVASPQHLRLREEEGAAEGALEIESASGETTAIRYRHKPLPTDTGLFV